MRSLCIITPNTWWVFFYVYIPTPSMGSGPHRLAGAEWFWLFILVTIQLIGLDPPTKPTNLIHALVPELATFMCRRKSTQELPPRTRPRKTRVADLQDNPPIIHTEVYIRQTRTEVFTETDPSLLFDSRRTWTMTTRRLQYDRPT